MGGLDKWTLVTVLQKTFSQDDKNIAEVYNPNEKTEKITFRDYRSSKIVLVALSNGTLGIQAVHIKMNLENTPGKVTVLHTFVVF